MDAQAALRSMRYVAAVDCSPAVSVFRELVSPESPKPKLLDRVRLAVRARHYSRRTEKAYVHWIKRYILFHDKRHPAQMGAAEVTAFLTARLSGQEARIKQNHFALWNAVAIWKVESRYNVVGTVQQADASAMIQAAEELVAVL
jgi:hypothetical protein